MFARLRALQSRYQKSAIVAFAVLATLLFAASQIYAPLNNYITRAGTLTYLTLLVVLDISLSTSRIESNGTVVTVSHDHDDLMAEMINAAERSSHSTADWLEYAGVTVTPLVRKLREQDIRMRILIRNPALSGQFQRRRALVNLEALYKSVLSGYEAGV